jgi:hypothetical protein
MGNFLTVEQLISELQKYPKDFKVLVDGYEDGLDAVLSSKIVNVEYDESKAWYYGPFEEVEKSEIKAVRLISTRGNR